jgi:hypothetical protein
MGSRHEKRLFSEKLQGIVRDHDQDRYASTMRSTGYMAYWNLGKDESDHRYWRIEFHCETCDADVLEWRRDCLAELLAAMREHGLVPTNGSGA